MQLEFVWRDENSLREDLERILGQPVRLKMTDNTSTVMTVKRAPAGMPVHLRLHHMFLGAGPQIIRALALWIRSARAKESAKLVDRFIRENRHQIRTPRKRPADLVTRGAVHDLASLYDSVNQECFGGAVDASITWGKMPPLKNRRSIRFGSYYPREHLVRIHPLLDQPFVPEYFVRYIVFHEMLHAALKIEEKAEGRRCYHNAEFRRREMEYREYERALRWQEDPRNLRRLLRRVRAE